MSRNNRSGFGVFLVRFLKSNFGNLCQWFFAYKNFRLALEIRGGSGMGYPIPRKKIPIPGYGNALSDEPTCDKFHS